MKRLSYFVQTSAVNPGVGEGSMAHVGSGTVRSHPSLPAELTNVGITTSRKDGCASPASQYPEPFGSLAHNAGDMVMENMKLLQPGVLPPFCKVLSYSSSSQQACHGGTK